MVGCASTLHLRRHRQQRLLLALGLCCLPAQRFACAQWCPTNAVPTATAYNCNNRVGMACPTSTPTCRSPTGAIVTGPPGNPIDTAAECTGTNTWTVQEVGTVNNVAGTWTPPAAAAFAGQEMVCCGPVNAGQCTTVTAKRCDGTNECDGLAGKCRVDTAANGDQTVVCASDERGCGGLVDLVLTGALPGLSATGAVTATTVTRTDFPPGPDATTPYQLTLDSPVEVSMGPGLSSGWIKPYGSLPGTYSQAACMDYTQQSPVMEPSFVLTTGSFSYTQTADDRTNAAKLLNGGYGVAALPDCSGCTALSCNEGANDGCKGASFSMDTENGVLATYTPPANFIGTVRFQYTFSNPAGASSESTAVAGSLAMHVKLSECITDPSYCGEHGQCMGPSGCRCTTKHYFGERCDVKSEPLQNSDSSWGGWTMLFVVLILGGLVLGFVVIANKMGWFFDPDDIRGKEVQLDETGAYALEDGLALAAPPPIPARPSA